MLIGVCLGGIQVVWSLIDLDVIWIFGQDTHFSWL